ncbi:hypothetical protein BsWGS_04288 [Bradybaena similaris]
MYIMEVCVYKKHLLAVLVLVTVLSSLCHACVPGCQCAPAGTGKRQRGRNVDCAQHSAPIKSLASISFPPDTVHLNLAHNALVVLKRASLIQLSSLQKLNLSSNQIAVIEPGAFDGLQSLKKLDLSSNHIGTINSNMFSGMPSLEKLLLSNNRISVIPDGTFNDLRSLKRIEFSSEYLRCDCHLKWILKWTKTRHVRFPGSTVCALPAKMKGQPLSKLRRTDLKCDQKPTQQPIFDIHPSESQLVFQGDKLPFECHASVIPGKMEVAWFRDGQLVTTNKTIGVYVNRSHNLDRTVINHRLVVESLDASHAGEWSCVLTTATGNLTKTVHVDVRTPEITLECPSITNHTAKGTYTWDKSMAGLLVSQPCQRGDKGAMATHKCGLDGRWKSLNMSSCGFLKDITRKLAKFAKTDLDTADISTLTSDINKALAAAAQDGEDMDLFDVMFITRIMDMLLPHAVSSSTLSFEVASLIISLVSNVSALPQQVLDMAHLESRLPNRMVTMLEQMSGRMNFQAPKLEWGGVSEHVAVMVFNQQAALQTGITCVLHDSKDYLLREAMDMNFYCSNVIPEVNTPVYIHIPSLQTRKSPYSVFDINPKTSVEGEVKLNSADEVDFKNGSSLNNSLNSNETVFSVPETNTAALESNENSFVPNSDRQPRLPVFPALSPDASASQSNGDPGDTFSSLPLTANQLQALNLSSKQFSRLSKSVNISSRNLMRLPSSIDIPGNHLFSYIGSPVVTPIKPDSGTSSSHKTNVYIILYRSGKLFPVVQTGLGDEAFRQGIWAVVTPVIAVSLGGRAQNLSDPIVVTFEVSDTRRPLRAAYYDFEFINGYGGWSSDGCEIVQRNGSTITVHVQHLSNFALLQDISYVYRQASFAMEPVIYVGSGLCILCLLIVIVTFTVCFSSIGIPKKIKHAVVNICFSTVVLMVALILGINRTDVELVCQIAGICIHYLTLCAVFWITITSNISYKKFVKASQPLEPPPEIVPMPLPPKPILQFYFVGYGVPVIICGITAAVNLNFYAGLEYCFLEWEPSLGAFYAPVALLVAWNLVLFMRISCVVRSVSEIESEAANESEIEIHNNEIELVPSQPDTTTTTTHINSENNNNNNNNNSGSHSLGTDYRRRYSRASDEDGDEDSVSVKSIPDQERKPVTQLRSLLAILFLFIMMWMCGALAIAKPFHLIIPHQGIIFSYIYGFMSSCFGVFMISYFCITRKDSWLSWKHASGCAAPKTYTAPMEVTEVASEPSSPQPQVNGSIVKSNSNSNLSVYSQKSSNITKAYNMKNNSNNKLSNINFIIPNSPETSFTPAPENFPNFYNPRQNGAAKKFWQKNRHHGKIMNKDINRDLNSSLTDNNSAVELDHHRLSHDTSSDANTHLSIEIQMQAKDKKGSFSGSKEISVHVNNCQTSTQNFLGSSFGGMSVDSKSKIMGIRMASPDTGQRLGPDNAGTTPSGLSINLPQHQRSPSAGSLGSGVHPSAFTPVQPRSNNTLPRHAKPEVDAIRQRPEGPMTRHLLASSQSDAQGPSIEAGQRPPNPGVAWNPVHCSLPPLPSHPAAYSVPPSLQQQYSFDFGGCPPSMSLNPHIFSVNQTRPFGMPSSQLGQQHAHLPPYNIPPSPYLIQSQTRGPIQSMSPGSTSSHSQSNRRHCSTGNSWRPVSGGDSSDSSRPRPKRTHPVGSPIRTVTYALHSPVMSDSQAYESSRYVMNQTGQQRSKARSMDSDHHSDPTHRKKHYRSDRHSRNKLTNKQRSLGWNEQFKTRPSRANYVYVNHMYRDKVMHKLIKQASESDDLAKKAFWLPRSASEYERLTQKGFCNMADDSSSSSLDEDSLDDNVWIRQSSGSDFNKKETSV